MADEQEAEDVSKRGNFNTVLIRYEITFSFSSGSRAFFWHSKIREKPPFECVKCVSALFDNSFRNVDFAVTFYRVLIANRLNSCSIMTSMSMRSRSEASNKIKLP